MIIRLHDIALTLNLSQLLFRSACISIEHSYDCVIDKLQRTIVTGKSEMSVTLTCTMHVTVPNHISELTRDTWLSNIFVVHPMKALKVACKHSTNGMVRVYITADI